MRLDQASLGLHSDWSLDDPASWSGVIVPMVRAMEGALEVRRLDVETPSDAFVDRLRARLSSRTVLPEHSPATARRRSHALLEAVRHEPLDAIVAVASSTSLMTRPSAPVVQVTDATFDAVSGFYPQFSNLSAGSLRRGRAVERRARDSTAHYLAATEWAARSLVEDIGVDRDRVTVAPFGPAIPPPAALETERTEGGALRVLLVAGDWHRKNGEAALRIIEELRRTQPVTLTVVGSAPASVDAIGRRLGTVDRARLSSLYSTHDVLLEPARANASGVVITDALHHGLPVLATDVGGVATLVRPGVNGWLVPLKDVVEASVSVLRLVTIGEICTLSRRAAADAKRRLSWRAWIAALGNIDV